MLIILLPISVLLMFVGQNLLLVFGKAYINGTPALRILAWTPPIEVSCLISGTFLCATYRQRLDAAIASSMTVLNVVWTIVFIYFFAATGAAIATVGAAFVNAVIHYLYVSRCIGRINLVDAVIKPAACTFVMFVVMRTIPQLFWVWSSLAGVAAFVLTAHILRVYDGEDLRLFRSLIKR
jgi:O-antigen/teichoic acid export membrane protein